MKEFKDWFDIVVLSGQEILWQVMELFAKNCYRVLILIIIGWLIAKIFEKLANKLSALNRGR